MVDEVRKRLVQEMVREKERAVEQARQEEKEKYESRLSKRKVKNIPSKEGRMERATRAFIRQRIRMLQASRDVKRPLLRATKEDNRNLRLQIRLQQLRNKQMRLQSPQMLGQMLAQQKMNNFLNSSQGLGWDCHFATPQLEREVSGFNGVGFEGSKVANQISREVSQHGNIQHINPSINVEREVNFHSNMMDLPVSARLEQEVNFFSNPFRPVQKVILKQRTKHKSSKV